MLSRRGLNISCDAQASLAISQTHKIELPLSHTVAAMAKKNGWVPKHDYINMFIVTADGLLLPRNSICSQNINKLITNVEVVVNNTIDLPADREFCIDLVGNQELIINHIFEKKYNAARLKSLMGIALLQLGTGYGKTFVAATVVHKIGKKTLWVLPNTSILEQTLEVLEGAFPTLRIGKWYSECQDNPAEYDIILVIVNSLMVIARENEAISVTRIPVEGKKRMKIIKVKFTSSEWMDNFGLTIYDEVHKYSGPVVSKVFWDFSAPVVFAMSATVNEHQFGLDIVYKMHFGDEIVSEAIPGFQKDELNWKGVVNVIRYQNPPEFAKVVKNPITDCLCSYNTLMQYMADPARNDLIIKYVGEAVSAGHNVFVFCEYREHCTILSELYKKTTLQKSTVEIADELPTIVLRGGASTTDVDIARTEASVIFTTYSYTNVGVSITRMSCIVFASPRRRNMMQIIGRIERRGGDINKERLIYDIVDDLTPLRGQFTSRRLIYKLKKYTIVKKD
jgi:superfamily II DNA or RNA helicase